ncbi:hypothetical protein U3A58_06190 [Algoriphagus sp. C2-6-M1]|nr:hypothetical protein [Algoriphagus sp. C2-6-M1]MEB2779974.1 hypothetical protein [Algoriphagus sp. C2-6-M1]
MFLIVQKLLEAIQPRLKINGEVSRWLSGAGFISAAADGSSNLPIEILK